MSDAPVFSDVTAGEVQQAGHLQHVQLLALPGMYTLTVSYVMQLFWLATLLPFGLYLLAFKDQTGIVLLK